ncbi:YggT family protein [Calidifontibacter sp. DB0510]|uniref:YggT family protein n=1 Tax=Metallococcus carri TaxID=1656884 RepID=A0A967EH83_9MICO|nr:YggT family protein [Metallococcus carri]NHN56028.1 YggT family protein [Metallococcus carri]NOP37515.1 YggT family protein [Calidifontibacter sp. DB2511S]
MGVVLSVVAIALYVFFITLIARLVFDWIQVFARDWTPRGPVLVVAEGVYTVTDPPLKAIRRVVPPLQLGSIRLDLAFLLLILAVSILLRILS